MYCTIVFMKLTQYFGFLLSNKVLHTQDTLINIIYHSTKYVQNQQILTFYCIVLINKL